jgi:hypothetical protein
MALTKAQWNSFQAKLPLEDRTSYEDYLAYTGADSATVEATARSVSATARPTGRTAAVPTSSVPTTPVNQNLPAPVDPNPNRAVLDPTQYPKATITTYTGEKVDVYTGGPLQGQDANGNYPIQASGTAAELPSGTNPDIVSIMSGQGAATPTIPGGGGTVTSPSNPLNTSLTAGQVDSVAAIKALLSAYGIGDLGDAVTNAVIKGYSGDTIDLVMQDPSSNDPLAVAFQKRFSANKIRAAAGKSVLSPGEYLALERRYTETMRSYGVSGLAKRETLSSFIGNDVSPTEVADRVSLAVTRIQNADPETKRALAQYYPMLNQTDIVTAFLDPTEGLPALQRKVTAAEIGGAALAQGMSAAQTTAADLAAYGVTKDQARSGYATIAELTPRTDFLSQISQGPDYGQVEAEAEVFKGTASAKRARQSLTAIEQARFQGSAGTGKGSLGKSRQGAI